MKLIESRIFVLKRDSKTEAIHSDVSTRCVPERNEFVTVGKKCEEIDFEPVSSGVSVCGRMGTGRKRIQWTEWSPYPRPQVAVLD